MNRRNSIHGSLVLKSTGVLVNNSAGYPVGTTSFTVDGVNATTIFGTDNQEVYTSEGNKLGHIHFASVNATTVVVKSSSVHPVIDNQELFILSPISFAETRNEHLKIGSVYTKYSRNRRG